jgi:hypothetical protein
MPSWLADRRRALALAACALGAALGLYLVFGASDQKAVLSALREVALGVASRASESEEAHVARFRAVLARRAVPGISLSVPELGTVEGRDEIVALLALSEGTKIGVDIEQADVRVDTTRAQATLLVSFIVRIPGEERRQVRTVSADLVRSHGEFRVSSLALSAVSREQPEARP